ncbi:hypothetical protein LCGC14_0325980 [marine sediment metagenome]|uniref:Uncharacterized protein n=1 Tax=marine sediment metagenome TaxID=412755 RepID=A0A0F9U0J5_9ZZZZ
MADRKTESQQDFEEALRSTGADAEEVGWGVGGGG